MTNVQTMWLQQYLPCLHLVARICLPQRLDNRDSLPLPSPAMTSSAYFEGLGRTQTPVYMLDNLVGGQRVSGPALLIDNIRSGGLYIACYRPAVPCALCFL